MIGTGPFWGAVSEVLGTRPVAVTVEACGLTFIDSSGLMALARAAMRPPPPAWSSESVSRRPRFAASHRFAVSRTCYRSSDAKRSPDNEVRGTVYAGCHVP
jgi:hypothetical protein